MIERHHYPNIPQAIELVLWLWLLMAAAYTLLVILGRAIGISLAEHPVALALVNLIAIGLILRLGLQRTGASFREVFPFIPIRPSLLFPIAITIVGASILISEMDNVLRSFLPPPSWFTESFVDLVSGRPSFWGSAFTLVVVAPLTEELLVRGLILHGFLTHYSVRKAILSSALFFAVLHLNPWQFPGALILGILFAWWFVETGSLLPCLFGHALANALPLAFVAIFHLEIRGYTSGPGGAIEFQPLWFDLIGLLFVVSGIWLLIRAFPENRPEHKRDEIL